MAAGPRGVLSPSCRSRSRAKIGGGLAFGGPASPDDDTGAGSPGAHTARPDTAGVQATSAAVSVSKTAAIRAVTASFVGMLLVRYRRYRLRHAEKEAACR